MSFNGTVGECLHDFVTKSKACSKPIKTVLILVAMESEAQVFIDKFELKQQEIKQFPLSNIPSKQYNGSWNELKVVLVTNGRCDRFDCNNVRLICCMLMFLLVVVNFFMILLWLCC